MSICGRQSEHGKPCIFTLPLSSIPILPACLRYLLPSVQLDAGVDYEAPRGSAVITPNVAVSQGHDHHGCLQGEQQPQVTIRPESKDMGLREQLFQVKPLSPCFFFDLILA